MSIVTRPENGKKETNLNELYDEPVDIFLFSFVLCFISAHVFIQIIMGWKKKKMVGWLALRSS